MIKGKHIVQASLFCAFTFVMNYGSSGIVVIDVSGKYQSPRQVDIFAIHKKIFIKKSCFIQCFFTEKHKCSGEYFNLVGFAGVEKSQMISTKNSGLRKERRKSEYFPESYSR